MKDIKPTPGMWMDYFAKVQDELGRNLTTVECKLALQAYMDKKPVVDFVEELPE